MFDAVPSPDFPAQERAQLAFWTGEGIFDRSVEQSKDRPRYVFFEGPPTANGLPHWGSVFTRVGKDVFLRYKSMCGYYVPRRTGWDTHGLPVEVEVQKELGLKGKEDIEKMGLEAFSRHCLESVGRYIGEWERMSERIGFWLDRDGYATYHRSFVESVWWALSTFFEQGLLYQDYKSVWWWPQGNTTLSAGEVGEGYRAVDDPSVVVRFRLDDGTALLAWTTTPWTLPSNLALAVAPQETYAEVRHEGGNVILAEALVAAVIGDDAEIVRTLAGSELVGRSYEPLYTFREPENGKSYEVLGAAFVTLDSGTGVVHMAPAFGEDDYRVGKEQGLAFLQLVEPNGHMSEDCGAFAGLFFKEADKPIMRDLKERGLLFKQATYRHDYPFSPRAPDEPLLQYARRSWFIRTSAKKDSVVSNNQSVTWQPSHIREGRMGDFLRNNVDWAISRERWWGTPLPIWKNDETDAMESVGSVAEILQRNPDAFAKFYAQQKNDATLSDDLMVHRPWIDDVTWTKDGEPGVYRRVPEVIDCWFDAGSMPFAQWGYPHQNKDRFEENFPADFITEAIDQTRGWWNAMLQISTLLFPERATPHPFKSCVVLGFITDKEGRKQSKRLKNYEPPMEALDKYSADAVRWALLVNCVPGLNTKFDGSSAKESTRDLLLKVWNVLSFFVTYARIDKWEPHDSPPVFERATLDRWILAELDDTIAGVCSAFDDLEAYTAARRVQSFVDALSNWYLRRSRARFWASGDSTDKHAAFSTLHEVLCDLSRLLAPFTPFLAEELFQRVVRRHDTTAPVSVHLDPFPTPSADWSDPWLRQSMGTVRNLVALGLSVRAHHQLKVRQPLAETILVLHDRAQVEPYLEVIREELNVKEVRISDDPAQFVEFEIVPNFRALGPKLGKRMPQCKQALANANGSALYQALETKGEITIELSDGQPVMLSKDEIEVRLKAREGYAAASEGDTVVVLDTRLTPELEAEGLAREVIHHIQGARKDLDLEYDARITIVYEASDALAAALATHGPWIAGETLTTTLEPGEVEGDAREADVGGHLFRFRVAL